MQHEQFFEKNMPIIKETQKLLEYIDAWGQVTASAANLPYIIDDLAMDMKLNAVEGLITHLMDQLHPFLGHVRDKQISERISYSSKTAVLGVQLIATPQGFMQLRMANDDNNVKIVDIERDEAFNIAFVIWDTMSPQVGQQVMRTAAALLNGALKIPVGLLTRPDLIDAVTLAFAADILGQVFILGKPPEQTVLPKIKPSIKKKAIEVHVIDSAIKSVSLDTTRAIRIIHYAKPEHKRMVERFLDNQPSF